MAVGYPGILWVSSAMHNDGERLEPFLPRCPFEPSKLIRMQRGYTFVYTTYRMDGIGPATSNNETVQQDDDEFKIKGAASRAIELGTTNKENCTICLEPISDRAVAVPCNHLTFDFLCLVSWLQERSKCPLCNTDITQVQYEFRGLDDFSTWLLPQHGPLKKNESEYQNLRRRRGQDFIRRRSRRWEVEQAEDPALERRRRVYRDRLYALHVGANRISGYRDFTSAEFAASYEWQAKARMFLRRELLVFSFLDGGAAAVPRAGNREFLLEFIVAMLRTYELKGAGGHVENMLTEYLGRENATFVLHELEAWLRSPYKKLAEWDVEVQYAGTELSGVAKGAGSS